MPAVLGHAALKNEAVDQTEWGRYGKGYGAKLPKRKGKEAEDLRGLPIWHLDLGVFMGLLAGCSNLINRPCPHHSIRFLSGGKGWRVPSKVV